ncbi:hypothetical protein ACOMHN_056801 [Nucella lapillus]
MGRLNRIHSYLVMWAQSKTSEVEYTMMAIAVRDPNTAATVIAETQVLDKISEICGGSVFSSDYFITMNFYSLQEC